MLDFRFTLFLPMKNFFQLPVLASPVQKPGFLGSNADISLLSWRETRFLRILLASSLLIGLLSNINTTVNAQSAIAPVVAQSPNPATSDAVAKRLQGQWEFTEPSSGNKLLWIFTPIGELFMVLPYDADTRFALPLKYEIDPTPQPMHLNVTLPEEEQRVMTIFEFTAAGELRVQIEGTNPGEPRPTAFDSEATVFSKVDDATTLPPGVEIIDVEARLRKAQESEGKIYISSMNRAQQAYRLENEQFASNLQELGLGIESETEIYRYQILPQSDRASLVMMTATAKVPELRSYTGAVFVVDGQATTVTAICETDQPSSTPPAMPTVPSQGSAGIQCPPGSHLIK
ncbi:MAG: hypothetical protein F6K47_32375 [Symploca sp. SIO2E6]|nr:hypothetical protein [Symploca sp. SIO2E6]